jgi:phospholipase B1, membrane-associated
LAKLAAIFRNRTEQLGDGESLAVDVIPALPKACSPLPARNPADVITDLHPQDVRMVGAIGDSLTVGSNALSSTWFDLKTYRGLSWSMGADSGRQTMPNVLSQVAGSLIGVSYGTGDGQRHCNRANGGAVVQDLPGQANMLVDCFKSEGGANYESNWKVTTVLVGGNNLCDVCKGGSETSNNNADVYEAYLRSTLDILFQIPRTVVNLVANLEYTQIAKFKGPFCSLALPFVCDCVTSGDSDKQAAVRAMTVQYNERIYKVAADYTARVAGQNRTDWAVVVQPFMINTIIPDRSYISTADCFHPSGTGQAFLAKGLWNNMITPSASKSSNILATDPILCPTADTLIYVN